MQHNTTQISYELTFTSKDSRINISERASHIKMITDKLNSKAQFSEWPTESIRSFYNNSDQAFSTLRFTFNYLIEGPTVEDNERVYEYINALQTALEELQFDSQVETGMTVDTSFIHIPVVSML